MAALELRDLDTAKYCKRPGTFAREKSTSIRLASPVGHSTSGILRMISDDSRRIVTAEEWLLDQVASACK
jgi:hypothetical protein